MSSETSTDAGTFRPWHLFALVGLLAATVGVLVVRPGDPVVLVLLVAAMGSAGWVGFAVYRAVLPLATPEFEDRTEVIAGRTRAALDREKTLVLRAIKELEFDRAMRKVSDQDFIEMGDRLRARGDRADETARRRHAWVSRGDREGAGGAAWRRGDRVERAGLRRVRHPQRRGRQVLQGVRGGDGGVGVRSHRHFFLVTVTLLLGLASTGLAQPDPRQMSGIPLPDAALPDGTISVRVIRGQLSNNVPNHAVELRQGDVVETAVTDAEGRATFLTLNPGQQVQASTELDGERIQSQLFPVPGRGGVRLMLVGVDPGRPAVDAPPGLVTFGGESFVQVELVEESVEVYYYLELVNPAQVPVEPPVPIVLELPAGAQGVTVLQGSSPRTVVDGLRVEVTGPFDPGVTRLRTAYILLYSGDTLNIEQAFPVDLESVLLSVEQWGEVDFVSPQIVRRIEVPAEAPGGTDYVLGAGPRVGVGDELAVKLTGLPHRSTTPTTLTLGVALLILGVGTWGAVGLTGKDQAGDGRERLRVRREQLFRDLVTIERQHRGGKIGGTKYASRRSELFAALETVYRQLDETQSPLVLGPSRVAAGGSSVGESKGPLSTARS